MDEVVLGICQPELDDKIDEIQKGEQIGKINL
jgi:hypothetical protein